MAEKLRDNPELGEDFAKNRDVPDGTGYLFCLGEKSAEYKNIPSNMQIKIRFRLR